jgi:phosphinothricin acetyltransferase
MENLLIRQVQLDDAQRIAEIYIPYITGSTITFEEQPVTAEEMQRRIGSILAIPLPWLCAIHEGTLIGYAYASRWRERSAYRFVAETTIYMDSKHSGQGFGYELYRELLNRVKKAGIRIAIGVIALPNPSSVTLHEKLGFIKAGHFSRVGYKFEQWVDVGYWQCFLRSPD